MAILKNYPAPKGEPCTFFAVLRFDIDAKSTDGTAKVQVGGWLDEAKFMEGQLPIFNWHPLVPLAVLRLPDLVASAEEALVSVEGSPWLGGSITAAPTDLASAKVRRWALVKQRRHDAEFGPFTWDGSVFDGTPVSQERISKGALEAMAARMEGREFSEPWILADNSIRTLSGEDMFAVARAMGAQMKAAFAIGVALRLQIEAAETLEQVEAVAWPS